MRPLGRLARSALLILAVALLASSADAHSRSVSYSSWDIDGRSARVVVRVAQLELTRLPFGALATSPLAPELAAYFAGRLGLRAGDQPCALVDGPRALRAPAGRAAIEWRLECPSESRLEIRSGLFLDVAPMHLHFARVRRTRSGVLERVLSSGLPAWKLGPDATESDRSFAPSSIWSYLALGVEHIWTGYDHLAFVLALLLIASRLGEVATVVTGFTLAHSITLALAVLGLVEPERGAIEALIGFSIALVAAENAWLLSGRDRVVPRAVAAVLAAPVLLGLAGLGAIPLATAAGLWLFSVCYFGLLARTERPARLRALIAFVFGLVHGFGFAGVLAELELPTDRLAPALFGFNAGVEVGQLAVLVLLWPLLRLAARYDGGRLQRGLVEGASAAICGLGLFWFVSRAYG